MYGVYGHAPFYNIGLYAREYLLYRNTMHNGTSMHYAGNSYTIWIIGELCRNYMDLVRQLTISDIIFQINRIIKYDKCSI